MPNYFRLASAGVVAAALVAPLAAPAAPPVAPAPIPAPPDVPAAPSFAQRAAGRRAWFAVRDAYQGATGIALETRWQVIETHAPPALPTVRRGVETVRAEPSALKIALTDETLPDAGAGRRVQKVIANGTEVLATQFVQQNTDAPTRTFMRLTPDEGATLPRVLAQVQVAPVTRAAALLLDPTIRPRPDSVLWREDRPVDAGGASAESVVEAETLPGTGKTRRERIHRYLIDPATHRLLRYEEWDINRNSDRARPARANRPADDGTRTTYRREDCTVSLRPAPAPAETWAQTLPAAYIEKPLPPVDLPPLVAPPASDVAAPKALALLRGWRAAQERYTSVAFVADVALRGAARTGDSRPVAGLFAGTEQRLTMTYEKPGRARVMVDTLRGGGGWGGNFALLAVSDGAQVRGVPSVSTADAQGTATPNLRRRGNGTPGAQTVDLRTGGELWNALGRVGVRDFAQAIVYWFVAPPRPEDYLQADGTRITYDGPATLGGQAAQVVTITRRTDGQRANGSTETTQTTRFWFGSNGLPLQTETRRDTEINGPFTLERDQPPVVVITCRYRNLSVDNEPLNTTFVLPR